MKLRSNYRLPSIHSKTPPGSPKARMDKNKLRDDPAASLTGEELPLSKADSEEIEEDGDGLDGLGSSGREGALLKQNPLVGVASEDRTGADGDGDSDDVSHDGDSDDDDGERRYKDSSIVSAFTTLAKIPTAGEYHTPKSKSVHGAGTTIEGEAREAQVKQKPRAKSTPSSDSVTNTTTALLRVVH